MRAIDFFCGAGGFTAGLREVGIEVPYGIDSDGDCRRAYEYNNPGSSFVQADLRSLDPAMLSSIAPDLRADDADMLFVGCAPCQPFSQHRRVKSKHPDATLLSRFGALVSAYRPGQVLVENVPGLAKIPGNSTFNRFVAQLKRDGYSVDCDVLDAKHYGVPQSRRRLVLFATHAGEASLPPGTHGPNLLPYATVRDAIDGLPKLAAGASHAKVVNHRAAALSDLNRRRMLHTAPDGGSRREWPDELVLECHRGDHKGHSDVYGRMRWDAPSPALTGRCHSISNGRFGHPVQNRAISLREAASLQTFPTDYEFFGSMSQIAQQIGNAVPVRLAAVLGAQVLAARDAARSPAGTK